MLYSTETIFGASLEAKDGGVGKVIDIFFDDLDWAARYLVVDAGNWHQHKRVLISPHAVRNPDPHNGRIPVDLTREEVRNAPGADTLAPPSRRFESQYHEYYGYPFYWEGPFVWGGSGFPFRAPVFPPPLGVVPQSESMPRKSARHMRGRESQDGNLRSLKKLIGVHVQANDGEIGHVENTLLDDGDWTIRYLGVDTRNWIPGKMVAVPSEWVTDIPREDRKVLMNRYRDEIREAPEYKGPDSLTPDYARALDEHYHAPEVRG